MTAPTEEGGTFLYEFTLVDRDGDPVPLASLTDIFMTLYDRSTDDVIRARQSIKNANNGTYHATSGLGTMVFGVDDNPIITATLTYETHVALFEATWSGGGAKNWELPIEVRNLHLIPASA